MPRLVPSPRAAVAAVVSLGLTAAAVAVSPALHRSAAAQNSFDADLFALINQDRAAAGVPALRWNDQLGSIAESQPYAGCGFTIAGRAEDMISRNYFSHTICGAQNVFNVMQAAGAPYLSAGENIGWEAGITNPAIAAQYLNQEYMNSPEHRANIMGPYHYVGTAWAVAPNGAAYIAVEFG